MKTIFSLISALALSQTGFAFAANAAVPIGGPCAPGCYHSPFDGTCVCQI